MYRISELCVFVFGGMIVRCFCVCRISELCVILRVGCQKICGVFAHSMSEFRRCCVRRMAPMCVFPRGGITVMCCCVCGMSALWFFFGM